MGVDGEILISYTYQPRDLTWHALNKFKNGILEGISEFKVSRTSPTYKDTWVRDELAPGVFLVSEYQDCLLPQAIGCPPRTGIVNKIITSNGETLASEVNFGIFNEKNISGIMGNKILFNNPVSTENGVKNGRKYSTKYSLFDISDYANVKKLWETPLLDSVIPSVTEFGATDSHLFTDGSALIQLSGISGDYKNCRSYLKLNSAGLEDTKWIADIEEKVVAKGGKPGFSLSWIWPVGTRTSADRINFSGNTNKVSADCKGRMAGNDIKIITDNSGKVLDVILNSENNLNYLDEVVECDKSIGCILSDMQGQLSWADLEMNRNTSVPWFKISAPQDFSTTFEVYSEKTRENFQVTSLIKNWSVRELIGVKEKVATYLIEAAYTDNSIQAYGYKTFVAEYRIPDALYQVQAKIDAEKAAAMKLEEDRIKEEKARELASIQSKIKKITCKSGKKTKTISGTSPKCPKGFIKVR